MIKKRLAVGICYILVAVSCLMAQQPLDSVGKGFNALEHSMQKNFRNKGMEFSRKKFVDNTFIGISAGADKLVPRGGIDFSDGSQAAISLMKLFSSSNGMRLSGTWFSNVRQSDLERLSRIGVRMDHVFNISAFLGGYNPYRIFEISTVEGLGWQLSSLAGKRKNVLDIQLGLLFTINTGSRVSFFIEPRMSLLSDGVDHSFQNNWHRYDVSYGAVIGLNYRLGTFIARSKAQGRFDDESFLSNTFFSVAGGVQFQSSDLVREMGTLGSVGPHLQLSIGKWLAAPLGLRLSAFTAYNAWRMNGQNGLDELTRYAGGRLEAMVNPVAFFTRNSQNYRFGVSALVGVEFGKMRKQDGSVSVNRTYAGLTGGLQLKYYPTSNVAFFIEPRASQVPYSFTEKDPRTGRMLEQSFVDNIFNVSIGVEVRRLTENLLNKTEAFKGKFKSHYYLSFGGGLGMPMQQNRYGQKRKAGYQVSMAGGRQLSPLSGLRLGVDFCRMSTPYAGEFYYFSNGSLALDYTFDITTWMARYNPDRKLKAGLLAGPVVTWNTKKRTYAGMEGGFSLSYKLSPVFDIYIEPKFRLYAGNIVPHESFEGTRHQASLLVGLNWRLGKDLK